MKTAIEWLLNEFDRYTTTKKTWTPQSIYTITILNNDAKKIIDEARDLERQKLNKAYADGANDRLHHRIKEDYFNEEYGVIIPHLPSDKK
jgi:hypothetical protein